MAQIHFRNGHPGVLPSAWLIRPRLVSQASPVLAVHGLNREAEAMAGLLTARADATGRTIVLPVFDRQCWPRFQRAACSRRSDWALLDLLSVLRQEGWIGPDAPDLSGFSGGAQFAHRFAWLYPGAVARLCLAAPGWWTFPDARGAYPLGVASGETGKGAHAFRLRANLARFLDREILVAVGALDVTQDRNLRQDADIMAQQGANRVQRARNWTAAAKHAARQCGLRPRISLRLMPECGHSFGDCVANGALDRVFVPEFSPQPKQMPMQGHHQLEEVA